MRVREINLCSVDFLHNKLIVGSTPGMYLTEMKKLLGKLWQFHYRSNKVISDSKLVFDLQAQ
ncbi:MAG: hypothetical protein PG980_000979 [Wolbachia endosymbiont of Ctenocephalides felis wCfeJ]|nr:MAG: hypothetical protein PG980_000979 [Wolbachia endosymbiont of Ctenocephalides felis wCfeJ]